MCKVHKLVCFLTVVLSADIAYAECTREELEYAETKSRPALIEIVSLPERKGLRIFLPKAYLNHELTRAFLATIDAQLRHQSEDLEVTLIDDKYQANVSGAHERGSTIFASYGDCFTIARPVNLNEFLYDSDQEQKRKEQRIQEFLESSG